MLKLTFHIILKILVNKTLSLEAITCVIYFLIFFANLCFFVSRSRDRSKAFVMNHMRDVVYSADLERALDMSLDLEGFSDQDFYRIPDAYQTFVNYLEVVSELYPAHQNSKLGQYLQKLYRYASR